MKSFCKTALISGTAFGLPMGVVWGIVMAWARGVSFGVSFGVAMAVAMGVAFGLAMAGFMGIQRRRFSRARAELSGEQLLHDGPANHFLNGEGVGGWLFLTRERLLFRSHAFNVQPHEFFVPLQEIAEVQSVRTARLFPNGLRLVTRSGTEERFVVGEHGRWRDEIVRAQTNVA